MVPNPYTPGELPRYLAGRGEELGVLRRYLARVRAYGEMAGPPLVLHGPRGVGKTSLMRAALDDARADGFVAAWISCAKGQPFLRDLADSVGRALEDAEVEITRPWQTRLSRVGIELGMTGPKVSAELTTGRARRAELRAGSVSALEELLHVAAVALRDRGGAGLVLAIDELHAAPQPEVAVLLNAAQNLAGDRTSNPVAVLGAGLPAVRGTLTRAATFGERSRWLDVRLLDQNDAADLLVHPAAELGVRWEPAAVAHLVEHASGYPYFLQVLGDQTWEQARPRAGDRIGVDHARAGAVAAADQLRSLHVARWEAATAGERAFLAAMAAIGGDGPVARAAIARRLGVESRSLSDVRNRLLDKAIIEPADRGSVRFTVPGFARHVLAEAADVAPGPPDTSGH